MHLRDSLDQAEALLRSGPHPDRARLDAETLLLHLTQKNRAWLLTHLEETLSAEQSVHYSRLIARRLAGEPIQYITGETEFYGLPLRVTPDVLIPRPETEHLVEKTLSLAAQFPLAAAQTPARHISAAHILDVGTGSGAIAIALAHHLPNAHITATDISMPALELARQNAARNSVATNIRFLRGDLLAPVAGESFDLIVSNPPYVPASDHSSLAVEVRDFEPSLALFAGPDGLDIYRRLIPAAFAALAIGGFLLLEIGCGQSDAIRALLTDAGFVNIDFTPDLQGTPRVVSAQHP
jgi:release factor glutamine methyltransferase